MDAFFQWLTSNQIAAAVLITGFSLFVLLFLVAFVQGREISLWPAQIGAKPDDAFWQKGRKRRLDDFNEYQFVRMQWANEIRVNRNRIETANTIDWMGIALYTTIPVLRDELTTCLINQRQIRLLLVDPDSDVPDILSTYKQKSAEAFRQQIRLTAEGEVQKFQEKLPGCKLEHRYLLGQIPYRLMIVNRALDTGYMRLRLVVAGRSNNGPTFVFTKKEEPELFDHIVEQFEIHWQAAKSA